jgi:hypothetical protein
VESAAADDRRVRGSRSDRRDRQPCHGLDAHLPSTSRWRRNPVPRGRHETFDGRRRPTLSCAVLRVRAGPMIGARAGEPTDRAERNPSNAHTMGRSRRSFDRHDRAIARAATGARQAATAVSILARDEAALRST